MKGLRFGGTTRRRDLVVALACAATLLLAGAASAQASRPVLVQAVIPPQFEEKGGQIEGACGVAVAGESLYVSDYYHHGIDIFPDGSERIAGNPLNGPCGLAVGPGNSLYANDWHLGVSRVFPNPIPIDENESTGVAVDRVSGDVYVNDRTYVARYAAPVTAGAAPAEKIGVGSLLDGYGVAVDSGRVYVADAATDTVKVYEPAIDPDQVALAIKGPEAGDRFVSLADSSLAIDPTNHHLVVVDNLQPGFESPEAAVDEFSPDGTFLGQLRARLVHGSPSGLAFTDDGSLYVTTGNSERSNVVLFGPYDGGSGLMSAPAGDPAPAAASSSAAVFATVGPLAGPALVPALTVSARPGAAGPRTRLVVDVARPGDLTVSGNGLVRVRVRNLAPGRLVLGLRLDARRAKALARAHRLAVRATIGFQAPGEATEVSNMLVVFGSKRGAR